MSIPTPSDDYSPVPEASQLSGVPKRTIYRWIDSRKLKPRSVEGKTTVSIADVRALAAGRDAADQPGSAGAAPARAPTAGTPALPSPSPAALDGDLAATLFAAFDQGETPIALVQRLRLPPPVVLSAHGQYVQLKSAAAPTAQQSRLDQLQTDVHSVNADIAGLMEGLGRLGSDVAALAARLDALPVPERERFTCACGNSGWVAAHVKCTVCGRRSDWGFHPPGQ